MSTDNNQQTMGKEVKVTDEYLSKAVKPNVQGEGSSLKSEIVTRLLAQSQNIVVDRVFTTNDPIVLEWYYKLASIGKFGERLANLMSLDAYGKIKETTKLSEMSTDEKLDNIVSTVAMLAKNLNRTQRLTENTMTSQVKAINYLKGMTDTVRGQGAILSVLEHCLISETQYSPSEIKKVLDTVRAQLNQIDKAQNPGSPR